MSWTQGHSGKGYVLYNGTIKCWDVDPYHPIDQAERHQQSQEISPIALNFDIDPDGGIVTPQATDKVDAIVAADPRLYDAGQRPVFEDDWNLQHFTPGQDSPGKPDMNFIMSATWEWPWGVPDPNHAWERRHECPRCHQPDMNDWGHCQGCGYTMPSDGGETEDMADFELNPRVPGIVPPEGHDFGPMHMGSWHFGEDDDYRMQHTAPSPEAGWPLTELDSNAPDIYEHPEYYTTGDDEPDQESFRAAMAARGNPNAMVAIHRSAPVPNINTGDWVSLSHRYAKQNGLHPSDPAQDLPVHSAMVPAHTLWWNGDSINEFGYHGPPIVGKKFYRTRSNPDAHDVSGEITSAAEADSFHIGLAIPDKVTKEIHAWVKQQDWPKGTELEDPKDYHITLVYSAQGHEEHHDADWIDHAKGFDVEVSGLDEFGDGDEKATVLRISSPEVKARANSMQDDAEDNGLEISRFPGGYKPHLTLAYGPGKPDVKAPELKFHTGPSSVSSPREASVTSNSTGTAHFNRWTGKLCHCPWHGTHRQTQRHQRFAGEHINKLKKAPDKVYKTPEGQEFLQHLLAMPEQYESLYPYLAHRFKKGDMRVGDARYHTPDSDGRELQFHPYGGPRPSDPDDERSWRRFDSWSQLKPWHEWYEARQHPTRRGVNVMDPGFTLEQIAQKSSEHQAALQQERLRKEMLALGKTDHRFLGKPGGGIDWDKAVDDAKYRDGEQGHYDQWQNWHEAPDNLRDTELLRANEGQSDRHQMNLLGEPDGRPIDPYYDPEVHGPGSQYSPEQQQARRDQLQQLHHDVEQEFRIPNRNPGWHIKHLNARTNDAGDENDIEKAMEAEGNAMGHCIGTDEQPYKRNAVNGDIDAYSLRDPKGDPHATWHYNSDGSLAEMFGPNDDPIKPEYQDMLDEWGKKAGRDVREDDAVGHQEEAEDPYDDYFTFPSAEDMEDYVRWHGDETDWEYAHDHGNIGDDTQMDNESPNWDRIARDYLSGGSGSPDAFHETLHDRGDEDEMRDALENRFDPADESERDYIDQWNMAIRNPRHAIDLPQNNVNEVDKYNEAKDNGEEPEPDDWDGMAQDYLNFPEQYGHGPRSYPTGDGMQRQQMPYGKGVYEEFHNHIHPDNNHGYIDHYEPMVEALQRNIDWDNPDHTNAIGYWNNAMPQNVVPGAPPAPEQRPGQMGWDWPRFWTQGDQDTTNYDWDKSQYVVPSNSEYIPPTFAHTSSSLQMTLSPATELAEWLGDLGGEEPPASIHHQDQSDFIQAPEPSTATGLSYFPPGNIPKEYKQGAVGSDLYHVAPTTERSRILQHGLQCADPFQNPEWIEDADDRTPEMQRVMPPGVYAWPDAESAVNYGQRLESMRGVPHDVWRIPADQVANVHPDPASGSILDTKWIPHSIPNPVLHEGPEHGDRMPQNDPAAWARRVGAGKIAVESRTAMPAHPEWWASYVQAHPYLYHGTDDWAAEQMKTKGLVPWDELGDGHNWSDWDANDDGESWYATRPGHVYLTPHLDVAHSRAETAGANRGMSPRVVAIDTRHLDPSMVNPDEDDWPRAEELRQLENRGDGANPYASLGEAAEREGWGQNPYDTQEAIGRWSGHVAYRGTIPSEAITPMTDDDPLGRGSWTMPQMQKTADSPINQADATNDALGKSPAMIPSPQGDPDYIEAAICPNCLQKHRPDAPCADSSVTQFRQQERSWYNHDPNAIHGAPDGLTDHQTDLGKTTSLQDVMAEDYDCGDVWVDRPGKKLYLNIGDAFGDLIDDATAAAEEEWPGYEVEVLDEGDQPPGTQHVAGADPVGWEDEGGATPVINEEDWPETPEVDPLSEVKEAISSLGSKIAKIEPLQQHPEHKPRKLIIKRDADGRMESIEEV